MFLITMFEASSSKYKEDQIIFFRYKIAKFRKFKLVIMYIKEFKHVLFADCTPGILVTNLLNFEHSFSLFATLLQQITMH